MTRRTHLVQPNTRDRFGAVDVGQVDRSVMARANRLVRLGSTRIVVVDVWTVIIENVSPWERNTP